MCFSPTASFVAGAALGGLGGVTVKKTTAKSQIPFAAVPFLFGIQQIIEGVVWVSFPVAWLNSIATYAYAMFSHVLWPMYTPVAVLTLEKNPLRRNVLKIFAVMGWIMGAYLFASIFRLGITSQVLQNCINYQVHYFERPEFLSFAGITFYVLATAGSCLVSSHRTINIFGITLVISFTIAYEIFSVTFYSSWCFFAALLSVLVFWHFKHGHHSAKSGGEV